MASWSFIQSNGQGSAISSSARTLAYATTQVTAGDLLVVCVRTNSSTTTVTVSDTQTNTYTQVGTYVNNTVSLSVWTAVARSTSAAGANTVTVTPSASCNMGLVILDYQATGLSSLGVDNNQPGTGTSTSAAPGSAVTVPSGGPDLAILAACSIATTFTAISYTQRQNVTGQSILVGDSLNVTTSQSPTATMGSSVAWAAMGITFKGSVPGGSGQPTLMLLGYGA